MHNTVSYGRHVASYGSVITGVVITVIVLILLDFYVHKGLMAAFSKASKRVRRIINGIYWITNIVFIGFGLYILFAFFPGAPIPDVKLKMFMAAFVILYAPKFLFALFLLAEDIFRLFRAIFLFAKKKSKNEPVHGKELFQSRRKFISQMATLVAGIPFIGSIYGVTKGKYNFRIHKAEIAFKDLPKEFDGLKITQVSDIHCGSFGDRSEVIRGVQLANAQNSDIMFFTGDLVNMRASEMENWVDVFNQFKAPMGVYSIFGNHDYGDYVHWDTEEEKTANLERLAAFHKQIGFRLMRNENLKLERNGKTIELLGLENWGRGGFSKYGDFAKTLEGTSPDSFKILLSHDPTQWEEQVMNHPETIHLTLSGHTHGMQFGFEIPGVVRFSPIEFNYKRWAGLYAEHGRYLYVNRGFGYIGFPGRVGIWPEITVITLRSA
jgi:predicted MPP superfamily phosphohydrolase